MTDEPTEDLNAEPENTELDDSEQEETIAGPWKRVAMVIFSPRRVFRSLSESPRTRLDWMIPVGLSVFFTVVMLNVGYDFIRNDQIEATTGSIERNTKLSEEQKAAARDRMTEGLEKAGGITRVITNVGAVVGTFTFLALLALVMRAVTVFSLHGRMTFGDAFRIGALGSMVSLVGLVVKIPLLYSLESFAQAKLSLGFLFPEDAQQSFLVTALDFDLFTIWYLIVICIGMSVFAGTSLKKALIPMAGLWIVYRIAAAAITVGLSGIGA